MFTFTPLQNYPISQSILEFDGGIKILVDVGWDDSFDAAKLKELERQIPTVSLILLTHATLSHLGAYAHCCKHIPLFSRVPVYATTPVISLGRALLQDLYKSTPLASSLLPSATLEESAYSYKSDEDPDILLPPPSYEDITNFFSLINPLKYSQPHQPLNSPFSPPLDGLSITAYCAGHTLGGTIWQIQYGSESVVYAVDWNQARENVLPGAAWLGGSGATSAEVIEQLRQPTALICSSRGGDVEATSGSRKHRDELLQSQIQKALQDGGNVVIPCDTSARVLEISYMLERSWETVGSVETATSLDRAKLYLASPSSSTTMRYARSMLEWMDESIVREFEAGNTRPSQGRGPDQAQPNGVSQSKSSQPFEFKYLKFLEKRSELMRALATPGPKVFLASDISLEWGFAKDILRQTCGDDRNLVIITGKSPEENISTQPGRTRVLDALWKVINTENQQTGGEKSGKDSAISLFPCNGREAQTKEVETSPLEGHDLTLYQQYLARQRQRQATFNFDGSSTLETSADAVDDRSSSSSSSDEDSDGEHQGKALNISATLTHSKHKLGLTDEELGINILLRRKNVHDYDVRGKRGREKVFPFVSKRRRADDFGDLIRPEDYLRAEERDEVDGQDLRNDLTKVDSGLGQKRRWDDKEDKANGKKLSAKGNKRAKSGKGQDRTEADSGDSDDEQDGGDESGGSDDEGAAALNRGPTKAKISTETIRLQMKVANVDFSGIHDQRSLQMLIPLIKPRKLILIGGTEQEISVLAEDCRKLLQASSVGSAKSKNAEVLTPSAGSTVDASVDTNAWTVKLSQGLFKHLRWQNFRGLGIVTINGKLGVEEAALPQSPSGGSAKRQKLSSDEDDDAQSKEADVKSSKNDVAGTPLLSELPSALAGSTRNATHALHVGDLRLAELRKIMQSSGHTAEFKGEGTLLVDGLIAVRKSGVGKIEVESGGYALSGSNARQKPDASFFQVKKKIYEGLAVVAAR